MQLDIFLDAYPIFNDYFLICFIIQQEKKSFPTIFFSVFWEPVFVAVHLLVLYFVGAHRLSFAKFVKSHCWVYKITVVHRKWQP